MVKLAGGRRRGEAPRREGGRRPRFAALVGLLAAAVLAHSLLLLLSLERQARAEASLRAEALLADLDHLTASFFERYEILFDALAELEEVRARDSEALGELFGRLMASYPELENIAAADEGGLFFGSGQKFDRERPPSLAGRAFFERIAAGADFVIMEPHLGPISGKRVTGLVVRLEDSRGEFRGLIGSSIRLDLLLSEWARALDLRPAGLIVGYRGEELYRRGPAKALERAEALLAGRELGKGAHSGARLTLGAFPAEAVLAFEPSYDILRLLAASPLLFLVELALLGALLLLALLSRREESWARLLGLSEAKYRAYIDASPVGVFIVDEEGRCLDSNPAAWSLTGLGRDRLHAARLEELLAPEERGRAREDFAHLRDAGFLRSEYECQRPDGSRYFIDLVAVSLEGGRSLCYALDSTVRRRSSEALHRLVEEKQGLVREVHHRVRSSLSIIFSLLHFEAARTEPKTRERLASLQEKIRAISQIHERLYGSRSLEYLPAAPYFQELLDKLSAERDPAGRIELSLEAEEMEIHIDELLPLGLALAELVGEAYRSAFPPEAGGRILARFGAPAPGPLRRLSVETFPPSPRPQASPLADSGLFLLEALAEQLGGSFSPAEGGGAGGLLEYESRPRTLILEE